jgi:CHASE3 domain sensor protein
MNLDNFLLTPEEATNLANDLIQQQAYKLGVRLSEPTSVAAAVTIYVVLAIVYVAVVVVAIGVWVWCFTDVSTC